MANVFDAGKSITRAIEKGWAMKVETFLGPETPRVWAHKSRGSGFGSGRDLLKIYGTADGI